VPRRTPAALGLAFEHVRIRTADNLLLAGWLVPHPRARANVLFCHGHGRNRGHLAGLLPTAHALGLNVLAFDFRGHGDSPGHTSTFGHCEVEDLRAAHAFLRQRFPGLPVLLVGVSLGAAVSLQALPDLEGVAGVWSEGAFSRLGSVVQHTFGRLPNCVSHPLVRLYRALALLDCGFRVRRIRPIAAVRRVAVPVFFCHACRDELVPLEEGKALFTAHAGPARRWWVAGATHYNVRQRNREEYLRRLREFVEECLPREG
jgi:alpha-beta hydrolase superfamily lysophospholipase